MIKLKTIYRQEENVFVEILNASRKNKLTGNDLSQNKIVVKSKEYSGNT